MIDPPRIANLLSVGQHNLNSFVRKRKNKVCVKCVQVVYKELTCNWVKSKRGRLAWKVYYLSHLVPCELFPMGLDHVVRIHN